PDIDLIIPDIAPNQPVLVSHRITNASNLLIIRTQEQAGNLPGTVICRKLTVDDMGIPTWVEVPCPDD
ncbi:MAG: hypothetical protein DRI69_09940, partial [Bacteroidetes bacterium]